MSSKQARFRNGELFLGDCLPVLSGFSGRHFDLVYIDPPFNTGRLRSARLAAGDRASGTPAYVDRFGGVDGFLSMLEPRIHALCGLLAEEGSVWLHLGHQAVHDAKEVMDRVFGRSAFQGEIIWVPGNGARRSHGLSVTHQTILIYAPSGHMIWNADDPALREPYAQTSLRMHFKKTDSSGRRFRERTLRGKTYRYYADAGRRLGSVWTDCPAMRANTPLIRETSGYPTQKPEPLLDRILRAATHPNSLVLDPMCGSGTTLASAARLGRRFVGIDQSPVAFRIARGRLDAIEKTLRDENRSVRRPIRV